MVPHYKASIACSLPPSSRGSIRHWLLLRAKYISPLTITRTSAGGHPPLRVPDLGGWMCGLIRAHCSSVRSVGYMVPSMSSVIGKTESSHTRSHTHTDTWQVQSIVPKRTIPKLMAPRWLMFLTQDAMSDLRRSALYVRPRVCLPHTRKGCLRDLLAQPHILKQPDAVSRKSPH